MSGKSRTPSLWQLRQRNNLITASYGVLLTAAALLCLSTSSTGQQLAAPDEKSCDFDCIHGRCDHRTRSCICLPGWLGAGCDLCALGMACEPSQPELALILPQAGPITVGQKQQRNDSTPFVYAHGSGFPKGADGHYSCLFGSADFSQGQWLSSALVCCPLPKVPGEPAKLAFSLVPAGSNTFIPNQREWSTAEFTFFARCQPDQCQGHCLGPLCLCSHQRSGPQCAETNLTTLGNGTAEQLKLADTASIGTSAVEFRPYLAKLPIEKDANVRLSLYSDINAEAKGPKLDPFERLVYWPSPRGRNRLYSLAVRIEHLGEGGGRSQQFLNWTLRVRPSYSAELDHNLTLVNGTNGRQLTGHLCWANGAAAATMNGSVPLLLHISAISTDSSAHLKPLEDIPIRTAAEGQQQSFGHLLFPYLGAADKIAITIGHPGSSLPDQQNLHDQLGDGAALEWTQERVEVSEFAAEVGAAEFGDNGTLALNYTLRLAPLDGDCLAGWRFEVVEPRQWLAVDSHLANGRQVQLRLRPLVEAEQLRPRGGNKKSPGLPLRIAFICMPTGQSLIVRQTLNGMTEPEGAEADSAAAELSPKRLFVDLDQSSTTLIPVDIRLRGGQSKTNQLQRANLESASFGPFNLHWLSRPAADTWRLWLGMKATETEQSSKQQTTADSVDGVLLIQGAENLALSVPYRIQQQSADGHGFLFTLTVKAAGLQTPSQPTNWQVDVELFSQAREQQFVRTLLLNTPEQFGPLRSDLFQLRVNARHFLAFSRLIRINALDNAFIVELEPRPAQYFAFDGHSFESEWEEAEGLAQPVVQFRPAVFSPSHRSQQFVDVVFTSGPPQSFAIVDDSGGDARLPVTFPMASSNASTLCLNCGFRQLVQVQQQHLSNSQMKNANCSALALAVPFRASLPVGSSPATLPFRQHFLLTTAEQMEGGSTAIGEEKLETGRDELPSICQPDNDDQPLPQLALRTRLLRNCPLARLRRCRPLFRAVGPRCQRWWRQLPDGLLSVHSLAQLALLDADSRRERAGPDELGRLIECIGRVDRDCPVHPLEAEMAPHQGGQLFNQMGYLKPYRAGLQSLFPALGLVEAQLVNFPRLLADFFNHLDAVFPPSLITAFTASDHFYDQFVAAIGSNSPNGSRVEMSELDQLLGSAELREAVQAFVQRWNWLTALFDGDRLDLLEPGSEANVGLTQIRDLVERADRLKSVTRQFGAENPFAMFRDVMGHIFDNVAFRAETANTTAEGDRQEQTIGWADVRVEPKEAVEGQEFRVFASVQSLLTDDHFASIRVDLRFGQPTPLKFRVGPVFNSGPEALGQVQQLKPGQRLRVDWTVLPVPEFRLTEPVRQELELVFSYELAGQLKAQRLRTPPILIRPRPTLRLLAFAHPTVPQSDGTAPATMTPPFSLLLSAINAGYAPIDSVQLHELRPQLVDSADQSRPVNFRIGAVRLESAEQGSNAEQLGQSLAFGSIPSGKASHLAMNLSLLPTAGDGRTTATKLALFRNFSAIVSVNGALLPSGQFDQRFFLIQDAVRDQSLLIVSEHSSPMPLYLFSKRDSSLTPLTTLQMIEEKEARPVLNGHPFLARAFALRRLAIFPSQSAVPPSSASANGSASLSGAVLASLAVDSAQTFANGAKLLRIAEIGPQNRQRPLDMSLVWIGQNSNEKTTLINFVDPGASVAIPQLIYELLFGRPEHFRAPFFTQPLYQLHLAAPVLPQGQQVLARLAAVSPTGRSLSYSLWSRQEHSPFSIVPSTGDLVLNHALSEQADYCLNLEAADSEGHSARVPLQISILGMDSPAGSSCQLFPAEEQQSAMPLYNHKFKFKPAEPERHVDQQDLLVVTLAPTSIAEAEEEEKTTSSPTRHTMTTTAMEVQEVGGADSTLAPLTTTANQLATAGEEISYELVSTSADGNTLQQQTSTASTTAADAGGPISNTELPVFRIRTQQQQRTGTSSGGAASRTVTQSTSVQIAGGPGGGGSSVTIPRPAGQQPRRNDSSSSPPVTGIHRESTTNKVGGGTMPSEASAASMADLACRLRATKPIWALICDMAKTAYRSALQST